jgi:hypothetical protein
MHYNYFILLLVWAKFIEISFCDEFIDYSPYFLLPCSDGLDYCSYGLGPKEKEVLSHSALVTTHICSIMVFVSHIVMTFSWMVSSPALR